MKRGLSLSEAGERASLDRTIIARAERKNYDPRASTVLAIARGLGAPICELYGKKCHHQERVERSPKHRKKK